MAQKTPTDVLLAAAYDRRFRANVKRIGTGGGERAVARLSAKVATARAAGVSVERVGQAIRRAG